MLNRNFTPPIADEMLEKHNFFDLYPMDGGGRFISEEIFGTLRDDEICDGIFNRQSLSDFGSLPDLDFGKYEKWRTVEKSCWLNRFYFLPPIAKAFWLTGNEAIAKLIKEIILKFIRSCPPPGGKEEIGGHVSYVYKIRARYNKSTYRENQKDETDVSYIWFDFQPASRLIHLLYAAYFLRSSKSISPSEWEEINESIYKHAEVIFIAEEYFMELERGNHQSLRGLALLYAGCFLKNGERRDDFLNKGLEICNFHIRNDFMPDGTLHENSPSYHIFESWHMRDAYLLSKKYGFPLCPEVEENLKKAAFFIQSSCQPDFYSPVINDGYGVDVRVFLKTFPFREFFEKTNKTNSFDDAGIVICREKENYLLVDSSPYTGRESHYHAGKNALTYWREGMPFFVDSGCCSYEDKLFSKWYKQGAAHSTLLVNGSSESINEGTYCWVSYGFTQISGWKSLSGGEYRMASILNSNAPEWRGVAWERKITVSRDFNLIISDSVDVKTGKTLDFIFNLHPGVKTELKGGALRLSNSGVNLKVEFIGSAGITPYLSPGKCFLNFRHKAAKRIIVRAEAKKAFSLRTEICLE